MRGNKFIPNPEAEGIARIFRGAIDLPIIRDDQHVFPPDDDWTLSIAEGLVILAERGHLDNASVLHLGCGSGNNSKGLRALEHEGFAEGRLLYNPPKIIGVDIWKEAVDMCWGMVESDPERMHNMAFYESDLLESADIPRKDLKEVTVVEACLPSVAHFVDLMGREAKGRSLADVVNVYKNPTAEEARGYGLLARALDQVREYCPKASVLFNVARQPHDKLEEFFEDHGFPNVEFVVDRMILHDRPTEDSPGTDLTGCVFREMTSDDRFEFFGDEAGEELIDATEAHKRVMDGQDVYHKLYAVFASPEDPSV